MAPKGKRKASTSTSPTKTPRPRKRINLNETASTPSRGTRSRKAALVEEQEEQPAPTNASNGISTAHTTSEQELPSTSRLPGLSSRLSISSFSIPFLHRTPSFSSTSSPAANGTTASESIFSRLSNGIAPVKSLFNSKMRKSDDKGKQRQKDEEEESHLSAQESARMIELLDTPVSVKMQPWQSGVNVNDDASSSDGAKGLESSLDDPRPLLELSNGQEGVPDRESTATSRLEACGSAEDTKEAIPEDTVGANEESHDMIQSVSSPLEEGGLLPIRSIGILGQSKSGHTAGGIGDKPSKVSQDDAGVSVEEVRRHDGIFPPERDLGPDTTTSEGINKEEDDAAGNGLLRDDHEEPQPLQMEQKKSMGRKEANEEEPNKQVDAVNAVIEDSKQVVEEEDHQPPSSEDGNSIADEVTEQVGQLTVDEAGKPSEMSYHTELEKTGDVSDEEEDILIPSSQARQRVIDLTDSVSPEPEVAAARTALPRHKPSGFFASGLLAREKEGFSSPASRVIQQLGQRHVSSSSVSSKASRKSLSGFRKKDPIFSQARKSMARSITHSKVNDILSSLKRYVKKTMHTPFLDDMLRKRIALAKVLEDETPEDEIQIRHLREILKRSTYSLRPARRQLKEQERLAHEAKLLRKRAMGILGRQPLSSSLAPDQEDLVTQTFQKQGKIAQMVGAGVEARDIAKLKPREWLNDEVINFYMKLILKRSDDAVLKRKSAREAKKRLASAAYTSEEERTKDIDSVRDVKRIWNGVRNVWTFNSFFWVKINNEGYSGVRQWTRKVDIFTKDLVLLPINMGQLHWVCAAINMRQCRFEYYDSLRGQNRRVFVILRDYLASEYNDKKKGSAGPLDLSGWKNYFSRQSPTQANGSDCGVFSCMTLEQLSRRSPADGDPMDNLTVEAVVKRSNELAEQRGKAKDSRTGSDSDSDSEPDDDLDEVDYHDDEEEEWNFSQSNMPYLRRRMVYEIAKTRLLDE